ncbi:HAD-IIB family hydrolase [Aestuariispira insulae]|uniref:Sucrose phosphatase-like domain-containing protein n=1 Tax=Aestuariispira insulae TaxID=1461337 RepID=A0A3D9HYB1_9PROT|nr:HAD-IIB family hydrolase [Aestuariispira insulae]RED53896.1 hypothetical protein DFP90_101695 [Aestuariispira insulae]
MTTLALPSEAARKIRYLLTDVDDTITTGGKLLPETFQALHRLHGAGIQIVPVTGGCAGWCDQIARTWPVAAVIGENGAFHITKDAGNRLIYHRWQEEETQSANQGKILETAFEILAQCPSLQLAKDQSFRLADVAIDYNQDVSRAPQEEVDFALGAFRRAGINAKASSIHINAWIGDFNKAKAARKLLGDKFGLQEQAMHEMVLYAGDAPNDEPMFAFFPNSVGMANIRPHWNSLSHHPAFVTEAESGLGFVEMADALLTAQTEQEGGESIKNSIGKPAKRAGNSVS